jgi:hypothetical protein
LPVKPAIQTNAIEQPSPQIYWLSTAKLKIGVSQQALASSSSIIISEDAEKIRTAQDAVDYIGKHAKGGR